MDRLELEERFFCEEIWIYYGYILKLMYTFTLNSDLADDLAQETMLLCWRKVDKVKKYESLKSALFRIARNHYNEYYRSSKNVIEVPVDPDQLRWVVGRSNIDEYITRDEDVHECLLLFKGIKREYAQVVLLADYYGFSMKEIAELLHMNYNTVVSHHKRGLAEIRKKKGLYEKLQKGEFKVYPHIEEENPRRS